jgi:hypothetical protein
MNANKRLFTNIAFSACAVAVIVSGKASAGFVADVKSDVSAKSVTQVGVAYGQSAIVQNSVGGVSVTGLKHVAIKLNTKVKTGDHVQVGLAVSGYNQMSQSNLGSVNIAVP